MKLIKLVALAACAMASSTTASIAIAASATTPDFTTAMTIPSEQAVGGKWKKCILDEIVQCMSCVLEVAAEAVKTVISACEVAGEAETVEGVLKTLSKALECGVTCASASADKVARQCNTMYCETDFCVQCCGKGQWQCIGNDFTPQCAPKITKASNASLSQTWAPVVVKEQAEQLNAEPVVISKQMNASAVAAKLPWEEDGVAKCRCGPGSGDPDSCCSKCQPSPDIHNVPACPGGGKNTGPFCGNDFHVTEPNACYGDRPYCCTNDMGIPVCCQLSEKCHSPSLGDNGCLPA
jgi:hypothetical protein